jgi:predicted nucleic acid-binding protein
MSSSSFPIDSSIPFVADASVIINLNATGRAADIVRAFPNPFQVTSNACAELAIGQRNGYGDAAQLAALIDDGVYRRVELAGACLETYESLIEGSAVQTLDDGEAATIAYAAANNAVAVIDERKALRIGAHRFSGLLIVSTAELLTHPTVESALGPQGQADAVLAALRDARMRVPPAHIKKIVALIGNEAAVRCPSLPKAARLKDWAVGRE